MNAHFTKLQQHLKDLHNKLSFCIRAFQIWKTLTSLMSAHDSEEQQAQHNAGTINQYKYFFLPTKESLRRIFILEIVKIYDTHKSALSIIKIKNIATHNKKQYNQDAFIQHNKDRDFLEELAKNYSGIQT